MFDKIKSDLTTAMKERDKFKLDVIRMLKTAVQNEQIAKMHELSDDEILTVIKREVKKRESSKEEYAKYGKLETVESLTKEIEILNDINKQNTQIVDCLIEENFGVAYCKYVNIIQQKEALKRLSDFKNFILNKSNETDDN